MPSHTLGEVGGAAAGVSSGCVGSSCPAASPVVVLVFTVLASIAATAVLGAAIMTDEWEHLEWDYGILVRILGSDSAPVTLKQSSVMRIDTATSRNCVLHRNNHSIFLVPMIGGIWNLCIDLTQAEMAHLGPFRHSKVAPCINYLANEGQRKEESFPGSSPEYLGPHLRMQNLAISCALVCLIILGSASLLGAFGVCQNSAILVTITGVMYLLAALFTFFTAMIMLFKRQSGGGTGTDFDGTLVKELCYVRPVIFQARVVRASWSLYLAWGGGFLCAVTSLLWLFLSKILRYTASAFVM